MEAARAAGALERAAEALVAAAKAEEALGAAARMAMAAGMQGAVAIVARPQGQPVESTVAAVPAVMAAAGAAALVRPAVVRRDRPETTRTRRSDTGDPSLPHCTPSDQSNRPCKWGH